jgi:hypothetical protein
MREIQLAEQRIGREEEPIIGWQAGIQQRSASPVQDIDVLTGRAGGEGVENEGAPIQIRLTGWQNRS